MILLQFCCNSVREQLLYRAQVVIEVNWANNKRERDKMTKKGVNFNDVRTVSGNSAWDHYAEFQFNENFNFLHKAQSSQQGVSSNQQEEKHSHIVPIILNPWAVFFSTNNCGTWSDESMRITHNPFCLLWNNIRKSFRGIVQTIKPPSWDTQPDNWNQIRHLPCDNTSRLDLHPFLNEGIEFCPAEGTHVVFRDLPNDPHKCYSFHSENTL